MNRAINLIRIGVLPIRLVVRRNLFFDIWKGSVNPRDLLAHIFWPFLGNQEEKKVAY
jgi:hypothetical protein